MTIKLPQKDTLFRGLAFFLLQFGVTNILFNSVLFESKGIIKAELGILLTIGTVSGLISPFILSYLASVLGGARNLLATLCLTMGVCIIAMPHLNSFATLAVLFFILSSCVSGSFVMMSAFAQEPSVLQGYASYYKMRSIATFGFASGCLVSWFLVDKTGLPILYIIIGTSCILSASMILTTKPTATLNGPIKKQFSFKVYWSAIKLLWRPETIFIISIYALLQVAFTSSFTIQGNYILHYFSDSKSAISISSMAASIPEIPIMLIFRKVMMRYGMRRVLLIGFAAFTLKVMGMAMAQELWQLYIVIGLHGFYIAGASTAYEIFIKRSYPDHAHILLPICLGVLMTVPRMAGSLAAGFIWEHISLRAVYGIAAVFGGVLFMVLLAFNPWLARRGVE